MKICCECKIEKDIKNFAKDKTHKDGHKTKCKECSRKYTKKWYQENKENLNKSNDLNIELIENYGIKDLLPEGVKTFG